MAIRVFIGVGHGGSDKGASCYVVEKDANLTIALEMRRVLEEHGIIVGMSRTKDENDPIGEEIREANAFKPDLAIEVHNNAAGGDGFEAFIQTNQYASQSKACAKAIEAEVKAIGQNSRGLKTKVFGWTYNVKAPAVLLEGFFVDNWNDAKDFDTVEEQKKLAGAYARGILKYLGVTEKVPAKEPEAEAATYVVTAGGAVAYAEKAAAESAVVNLAAMGFTAELTSKVASPKEIKEGSKVKVKQGAKYYDDGAKDPPNPILYNRIHTVHSINGNRVVLSYSNTIVGAVHKDNLILV